MAIINMTQAGVQGEKSEYAWEYEEALSGVGNGDTVLVPDGINKLSVTLSVSGGGKGKIQTSTDTINTLQNGTPVWIDWSAGEVAVNTQDVSDPVSAIRLVQTFAGATKMTIRAQ